MSYVEADSSGSARLLLPMPLCGFHVYGSSCHRGLGTEVLTQDKSGNTIAVAPKTSTTAIEFRLQAELQTNRGASLYC